MNHDDLYESNLAFTEQWDKKMRKYNPSVIFVEGNFVRSFDDDGQMHHESEEKNGAYAVATAKVLKKEYQERRPDVTVTLIIS